MKEYFTKKDCNIIFIKESNILTTHKSHVGHGIDHKHLVGRIYARKTSNRLVYKYHYNIIEK